MSQQVPESSVVSPVMRCIGNTDVGMILPSRCGGGEFRER